ncbi:nucleotidyltransferase domain-containing protein [Candidatus Nitrospira allomarina]|uniref:Nucleotidyltransferase domain-containing protein n=1 Tax=Candidatus Nitrospira allomarina TaxID=3020900 RepID=A0AA96JZL1_9BACT|nr:nucleotidyltransferase domain-containing protein [Candidatus Nitrospira allomarina]WNM58754.1 nucleotidyltransferase domain-containing protein [Candidatus Nitrospira allomarina]
MPASETIVGLKHRAIEALEKADFSWADLSEVSEEIILYGSRAAGVERESSDWDFLCVGSGKNCRKKKIEIKWVSHEYVLSEKWLGSELAGHIAKYGIWLKGNGTWVSMVFVSADALKRKEIAICGYLAGMKIAWYFWGDDYKNVKVRKLRRHIQRFDCLFNNRAVPPNFTLDQEWGALKKPKNKLEEIMGKIKCVREYKEFIENTILPVI